MVISEFIIMKATNNINKIVTEKGSIIIIGMSLISIGSVKLITHDYYGALLIGVGSALVYWREHLKLNSRWKLGRR